MNDQITNERPRRRVLLAVVLSSLAAAVALPVGAALAGGGDRSTGGSGATLEQVQQESPDREQPRPGGHPCPDEAPDGSGEAPSTPDQAPEGSGGSSSSLPQV